MYLTPDTDSSSSSLGPTEASTAAAEAHAARGEKTAENIRYGESLSEHGFGGETTGNDGTANDGAYGRQEAIGGERRGKEEATGSREASGYGRGSGVGG